MRSRIPKALHPVCGQPMIGYAADAMRSAGVQRVVVVAPSTQEDDPRFADAAQTTQIAVQPEPLGTANALLAARRNCERAEDLLVGAADTPLVKPDSLQRMMEEHNRTRARVTILTARVESREGRGRVQRDDDGSPNAVVEEAEADEAERATREVNAGWYCFDAAWLWNSLERVEVSGSGEKYLTDLIEMAAREKAAAAVETGEPSEAVGVNDRIQLAEAERLMRERIRRKWMLAGVTFQDPATTYVDAGVTMEPDTVILAGSHLLGNTRVGRNCRIGPYAVIEDCQIGQGASVVNSHCEEARIGPNASVGPFSRLRPGADVGPNVYVGNYAEIKNSVIRRNARIGHFSAVLDAYVGRNVNVGAGAVTCNYDGIEKHQTIIGDGAFIGSGCMLVAPVEIGRSARTGAGSVVTGNVPAGETVLGVPARPMKRKPPRGDHQQP